MALGRDGVLMGEKLDVPCPCPVQCLWEPFPPCFICSAFCKCVLRTKTHTLPASCSAISAH